YRPDRIDSMAIFFPWQARLPVARRSARSIETDFRRPIRDSPRFFGCARSHAEFCPKHSRATRVRRPLAEESIVPVQHGRASVIVRSRVLLCSVCARRAPGPASEYLAGSAVRARLRLLAGRPYRSPASGRFVQLVDPELGARDDFAPTAIRFLGAAGLV